YLNLSGDFKGVYLNFSYSESNRETYFVLPSFSSGILTQLTSAKGSLGYKKKISNIFSIDGKFNYDHIQDWYKYDHLSADFYGLQQIKSDAMEIELNGFITPSPRLDIKTGVSYRAILDASNNYDLPSFGSPSLVNNYFYLVGGEQIVTRAFYTQVNYKPFSKLELVAGVRLEQMPAYKMGAILAGGTPNYSKAEHTYNENSIEIIPRFAAIYSFNDNHVFKFLYGKAANRPSFLQNSRNSFSGGFEDLRPERIQTVELNYIAVISEDVTLNASFFANTLENLITRVVESDANHNYKTWSANAGEMVTHGVEITMQTRPVSHLNLELSTTFQQTQDKRKGFEDIAVAYSPDFLGYIKTSYKYKKLALALTGYYVSSMETYWDETIRNLNDTFGNRIGQKSPGYFNLSGNFRLEDFPIKGAFVNIKVYNLLNKEIRYPAFTSNPWMNMGSLGHSRQILLSVGCQW
ncbi:MAG TPA: TonB-dependent receptor, partial [Candidatus Kapabacteria bacterium]|nr:TonB-dependent receptor [Candidatus Kapabacteria bacterium]